MKELHSSIAESLAICQKVYFQQSNNRHANKMFPGYVQQVNEKTCLIRGIDGGLYNRPHSQVYDFNDLAGLPYIIVEEVRKNKIVRTQAVPCCLCGKETKLHKKTRAYHFCGNCHSLYGNKILDMFASIHGKTVDEIRNLNRQEVWI